MMPTAGGHFKRPRRSWPRSGLLACQSLRFQSDTPRSRDNSTGEWKDGDTLFLTCVAWRQLANHVAESLERGNAGHRPGRLKRTVYELEADEAGPSLRSATAKVSKIGRSGNGKPTAAGETPSGYSDDEPPF